MNIVPINLFTPKSSFPSEPIVEAADVKAAMRTFSGGVSVVTAGSGTERTGATVTSATSFSLDPPTMIVNINRSSSTWPVIQRFGHFCVNILSTEQKQIADRFAGVGGLKGAERYLGSDWTVLESGAPVLVGSLASVDCVVDEVIERHSHAIILGRIVAVEFGKGGSLVYHDGQYGQFEKLRV